MHVDINKMTIKLLVVGKTDKLALQELINMYTARLKHYIGFELQVLPDLKNTKNMSETQQKEKEGNLICNALLPTDLLILLDENGKSLSSVKFSQYLQKKMLSGCKQLVFVIGGPYGFSEEVYKKSQDSLSLSKMTFSHQMIRLFMVEQLYRGFTILKNEPYHHR